ncbi:hypothetical protein A5724_08245 [Mycobacterium sp. ACS1612]|nr:hypothetical protein A5724_08245 [Mycobacterium sp. ACS1612]
MGRTNVAVEFDHHSEAFSREELEINADLRNRCPVAWNEKYGGFWYVCSYDAVEQVARDGETFAHKYERDAPDGVNYQGEMGIPRPEGQPPLGIGEVDGPYHLALSRTVSRDTTLGGQHLRRNDQVIISWFSANRDAREFERADEMVLDRAPNHHVAFGLGQHRCIGAPLARVMSR